MAYHGSELLRKLGTLAESELLASSAISANQNKNALCKLPAKPSGDFLLSSGAGEGNRTLVCSLGSWTACNHIKHIAAKQRLWPLNQVKGLRRGRKTFLLLMSGLPLLPLALETEFLD
jgi:hypothetical protein